MDAARPEPPIAELMPEVLTIQVEIDGTVNIQQAVNRKDNSTIPKLNTPLVKESCTAFSIESALVLPILSMSSLYRSISAS